MDRQTPDPDIDALVERILVLKPDSKARVSSVNKMVAKGPSARRRSNTPGLDDRRRLSRIFEASDAPPFAVRLRCPTARWTFRPVSDEPERRRAPQHANLRLIIAVLVAALVVSIVMLATLS